MNSEAYKRWAYQSFFKGYLRLVTSLDENISRLLRYLDESGLSKNTIKPKNWHESIYYHYFSQFEVPEHEGIRTKEYKLIRFYDPKGNSFNEMYHLSNDPGEMKNIYLRQKYKTIKNRLKTI